MACPRLLVLDFRRAAIGRRPEWRSLSGRHEGLGAEEGVIRTPASTVARPVLQSLKGALTCVPVLRSPLALPADVPPGRYSQEPRGGGRGWSDVDPEAATPSSFQAILHVFREGVRG